MSLEEGRAEVGGGLSEGEGELLHHLCCSS